MIREVQFQGQKAYAAFMDANGEPTSEDGAELIKIITDDGSSYWLIKDDSTEKEKRSP